MATIQDYPHTLEGAAWQILEALTKYCDARDTGREDSELHRLLTAGMDLSQALNGVKR